MRQEAVVALVCLLCSKASGWGAWHGAGPSSRGLFGGGGGGLGSFGKSAENWRANVGSKVPWGMFNGTARATVGRQQQQQQQTKRFSIETWWEGQTKGSRGILIWLLPALLSQLVILKSVVPLFTDRISQYLQPLAVFLFVALTPGKGMRLFQNIMLTSSAIGTCFMFRDTYCAGSSWLPLEPREDSYAVVTGATSGLGRAFAQLLYSQGFNLILVAARGKQLREMRDGLLGAGAGEGGEVEAVQYAEAEAQGQIRVISDAPSGSSIKTNDATGGKARKEIVVISVDLSDVDGPDAVLRELKRRKIDDKVDVLINNAEVGARGALIEAPVASLGRLIDLNVRATVGLTRLLAPRMIKRDTGARILIVGSLAAAGPGPDVAVYTASKAFISSFASSMRRELLPQGVLVTLALAGPTVSQDGGVPSSFARSSGTADAFVFKLPGLTLSTEEAAQTMLSGMRQGRDQVVPGLLPRLYVHFVSRVLPSAAVGALARVAWQPPAKWIPLIGGRRVRSRKQPLSSPDDASASARAPLNSGPEKRTGGVDGTPASPSALPTGRLLKRWFRRFWYSPVIDYNAIRRWLAYPFRPKGRDVKVDDDSRRRGRASLQEDDDDAAVFRQEDDEDEEFGRDEEDEDDEEKESGAREGSEGSDGDQDQEAGAGGREEEEAEQQEQEPGAQGQEEEQQEEQQEEQGGERSH